MRSLPARKLAAASTAGVGAAIAAVAYLKVGGLPGVLYAAGILMAGVVGAVAILAGRSEEAAVVESDAVAAPRLPLWRRKAHIIAGLEVELEEHRHALANLAAQLSRASEAAARNEARLQQLIHELEVERDGLNALVAEERERFERTLDELGGGIGKHGNALAELERELEALIAR